MTNPRKQKQMVGHVEMVDLPNAGVGSIPARIDTGARTTAIWARDIKEQDGQLSYVLFGKGSPLHTGERIFTAEFTTIAVASSNGQVEIRYKVPLSVRIGGRRIKTYGTLADRSTQAFPMLIGRNTLRGKFIVDVQLGLPVLDKLDRARYDELQAQYKRVGI